MKYIYTANGHEWKTKTEAKRQLKDIVSQYKTGSPFSVLDSITIYDMIKQYHVDAERRLSEPIENITIDKHPNYPSQCIHLHTANGNTVQIGIDQFFHTDQQRFTEHLRDAISPDIEAWKKSRLIGSSGKCSCCKKIFNEHVLEVDHIIHFSDLVTEFKKTIINFYEERKGIQTDDVFSLINFAPKKVKGSDKLELHRWRNIFRKRHMKKVISKNKLQLLCQSCHVIKTKGVNK